MSRPLGRQGEREGAKPNRLPPVPSIQFCSFSFGTTFGDIRRGGQAGDLPERTVVKLAGTLHVNSVLSLVFASSVRQSGGGAFNTKTIKRTTSSSSTSHDPNGNYLGLLGWLVGSNDAAAAVARRLRRRRRPSPSRMRILEGAP